MKSKLTDKQIHIIVSQSEILGATANTHSVRNLVAMGFYRYTNEESPIAVITNKGEEIKSALLTLRCYGLFEDQCE